MVLFALTSNMCIFTTEAGFWNREKTIKTRIIAWYDNFTFSLLSNSFSLSLSLSLSQRVDAKCPRLPLTRPCACTYLYLHAIPMYLRGEPDQTQFCQTTEPTCLIWIDNSDVSISKTERDSPVDTQGHPSSLHTRKGYAKVARCK